MLQETVYHLGTPLSVALLADLHDRPASAILSSLRSFRPDIICVAGDFAHGGFPPTGLIMNATRYALSFLAECAAIAPTFVSFGNHEWFLCEQDLSVIRSVGVTVLENSFVLFNDLAVGGLSSARFTGYWHYRRGFPGVLYPRPYPINKTLKPDITWLDAFEVLPNYKILLSHHPEYFDACLSGRKIDLILSGHAHGGQIRFFQRGLFAPGQGFLPKYTSGVYRNLVITRGLSNPSLIPRLFNPCEIVYLV